MAKRHSVALAARCCLLTAPAGASMLVAGGVQAQTQACDQLKGDLAARIDASGARGYTLAVVPAGTLMPSGAKAIGSCEAGKFKILYRRWAAAAPATGAQVDRARRPGAASAASAASLAVSPSDGPASAVPTPGRGPDEAPGSRANEGEATRAGDPAVAQPMPVQPVENVVAKVPLVRRAADFLADYWRWFLALALLPLAAWFWAWRAHRNAYDEAGLPRGPKL